MFNFYLNQKEGNSTIELKAIFLSIYTSVNADQQCVQLTHTIKNKKK